MGILSNLFKKKEEKKENDYKDLLEKLAKDNAKDLVWLLLGSLVSADTLTNAEACKNSIMMLNKLSEAIDRVSPNLYTSDEISSIKQHCVEGVEICQQDLEDFNQNEKVD